MNLHLMKVKSELINDYAQGQVCAVSPRNVATDLLMAHFREQKVFFFALVRVIMA